MSEPPSLSEDEVYEDVRRLVASGEYRDELYGIPGAGLEGGGTFRQGPDGSRQRIYARGTPMHAEAKKAGLVERLPPLTPASKDAIARAEEALGRRLPRLLRRLYGQVGNGGFGPGSGIFGVEGGHHDGTGQDAVTLYLEWKMPRPFLLPVCAWGCAIYSLVDLADGAERMWAYDPNAVPDDQLDLAFAQESLTFTEWLGRWTRGRLHQPCVGPDPGDGRWRAATQEELAAVLES
jgi:hypothetical protein